MFVIPGFVGPDFVRTPSSSALSRPCLDDSIIIESLQLTIIDKCDTETLQLMAAADGHHGVGNNRKRR